MGQYYKLIVKDDKGIRYNDRNVAGEGYVMAKLLEHSWIGNVLCDSVSNHIYNHEDGIRLIWCGDYAENAEIVALTKGKANYKKVWGCGETDPTGKHFTLERCAAFSYAGKFLVNHDDKTYLSFDEYVKTNGNDGWCIYPVSLLTAVGNGRGGGDYHEGNIGFEHVGTWAWKRIGIVDEVPSGYEKVVINFKED